jgi:hypothetical protein
VTRGISSTDSGIAAAGTSAAISRPVRAVSPLSQAARISAPPWPTLSTVSSQPRRWFHSGCGRRSTISRLATVTAPANAPPLASASSSCSGGPASGNSHSDAAETAAHPVARVR